MKTRLGLLFSVLAAQAGHAALPEPEPALPGYALGQPLAEARRVVPPGESPTTWVLRCSDDPEAPPDLTAAAHRTDGALLCWPMRLSAAGAERVATMPRRRGASEELEFRAGRVVRITRAWRRADRQSTSVSYSFPPGSKP